MKYKVKDISEINISNISKKDNFSIINYLDTSNITEGFIDEIKNLVVGKDKIPSRAKRKVKENDIIISTVRPNLKHYGIIKKPYENLIVSTGFAVISPKQEVNPDYLYWYLTQPKITDYLSAIAESSTTTYPSITSNVIAELEIDLPDRKTQDEIANLLSSLNDKYKLNIEMNNTIDAMAEVIFKRWFIDFDFPNAEGHPYKSSGGKLIESEVGYLPEGWTIKNIDEAAETVSKGTTPTKKDIDTALDPPSVKFIKVKDITDIGEIGDNLEKIPRSVHEGKLKRSILMKGDILYSIAGTIGRISYVNGDLNNSNTNQAVGFIRLKDKYDFGLVYNYLKTKGAQQYIDSKIVQAVQANVSLGTLKSIRFPYPTKDVLNNFNNLYMPLFLMKESNYRENQKLINIRNTLLPRVMNGETYGEISREEVKNVY
ncbi:hypothetical protein FHE72_01925 [Rossellomorea vietnamensis]|uniref:Type I restriction modification DNA specificity domain-containing protein n=1 Tax=Rossellomorea vietnamensis TaxID=218284 RepID=A0A6I6ULS1_9BACI|nr:restriction endonuclease subunit S [Rossellomorea vietnamensis]QHE59921.1 hypothetical protein FHE72_01925 [Rossellomorea vietnamensis]